jgi:hypothetical protein
VIREIPKLETDALLYLEPMLAEQLGQLRPFSEESVQRFLIEQSGYQIDISEPRFTGIVDGDELSTNLERLLQRVIRPKRRTGGGSFDAVAALDKRWRPWIKRQLIHRKHPFESRSGVPRTVDFYANSSTNIALETVRLSVAKADEVRLRADAEALKIDDMHSMNHAVKFYVYCQFSDDEALIQTNQNATKVLESVGARVFANLDDAAAHVEEALPAEPDGASTLF